MTETEREIRIKRLTYRSWHRGCKETDVILGHFADTELPKLSDEEIEVFEQLLNEFDADIWKWLVGKDTPSKEKYLPLLDKLQAYSDNHKEIKSM